MTTSDKPRRLAFELPAKKQKTAGNQTSSVELVIGTHKFKCRPQIDGITLLEFAAIATNLGIDASADENAPEPEMSTEQSVEAAGAILELLKSTIIDYEAFRKFVKDNSIGVEDLGEYAGELVKAYTDERPTQ